MRLLSFEIAWSKFASPKDAVSATLATGSKQKRKKIGKNYSKIISLLKRRQYVPKFDAKIYLPLQSNSLFSLGGSIDSK